MKLKRLSQRAQICRAALWALLLPILASRALAQAPNSTTALVRNGKDFVAAFRNANISVVSVLADIYLEDADLPPVGQEIPLRRNLLVTGEGAAAQRMLMPVISMNLGGRAFVRLTNRVTLTARGILFTQNRRGLGTLSPGLDMLATMAPNETALVVVERCALMHVVCMPRPAQVALLSNSSLRPPPFPGPQKVGVLLPQTDCVNSTSAPLLQRCWPRRGVYEDIALPGMDANETGALRPTGYLLHVLDTQFICEVVMTEACIQNLGTTGCFLFLMPPRTVPVTVTASPGPATGGSTNGTAGGTLQPPPSVAAADGAGGMSSSTILAIVLPCVLGGLLLIGVAVAAVLWRRRRSHQQQQQQQLNPSQKQQHQHQRTKSSESAAFGKLSGTGAASSSPTSSSRALPYTPAAGQPAHGSGSNTADDVSAPASSTAVGAGGGAAGTTQAAAAAAAAPPCKFMKASAVLLQRMSGKSSSTVTGTASGVGGSSGGTVAAAVASGSAATSGGAATGGSGRHSAASGAPSAPSSGAATTVVQGGGSGGAAGGGVASDELKGLSVMAAAAATAAAAAAAAPVPSVAVATPAADATPPSVVVTPFTPHRSDVKLDLKTDSEVELLEVVRGQGNFGRVVEGLWAGRRVAVKLVPDVASWSGAPKNALQSFVQEVEVLGRVEHPCIVQLLAACVTPPRLCLVMELMETSLDKVIHNPEKQLVSLDKVLHIGIEVARALGYLHPTIVHRDLPGNVLLNDAASPRPVVKLTDFGLSRLRSTVQVTRHPEAGTPAYMAPELYDIHNNVVTDKSDVYSLGVLLWELLSGLVPWHGCDALVVAYAITIQRTRLSLAAIAPDRLPQKLSRLITSCWEHDPLRRPAAAEIHKQLVLVQQDLQRQRQQQQRQPQQLGASGLAAGATGTAGVAAAAAAVAGPPPLAAALPAAAVYVPPEALKAAAATTAAAAAVAKPTKTTAPAVLPDMAPAPSPEIRIDVAP
ncbi:hypothetical protein HYH02_014098 [Chlamydomonas schloesseri]|uniref:Protein kinase domain-containing protein n=1 Tax=Chlamydomonas schloesseri TaxID=2026947 RepID=A0A835VX66_9CHLO|nr:hypothetical protein HYH02_014098 [Chlamydomonas schloesseri]|eukprot:KAG2429163.1 hypothetical protein HYH02_014098 [Chlamydomonas schloesseri]